MSTYFPSMFPWVWNMKVSLLKLLGLEMKMRAREIGRNGTENPFSRNLRNTQIRQAPHTAGLTGRNSLMSLKCRLNGSACSLAPTILVNWVHIFVDLFFS